MRRWTMALALLLLCCGVANAVDAPPYQEFPARRWTGTRWKTLTSSNARLVAYNKITTSAADTATAAQVVCTYTAASATWKFEATVTGTWWVWDQTCSPDSMVIGTFGLFCVAAGGVGSGSGDVTGAGRYTSYGPALSSYLSVTDSTGAVPKFSVQMDKMDSRYVNEAQALSVVGNMIPDGSVHWHKFDYTGAVPSDGQVLSFNSSADAVDWVDPNVGSDGVTSVSSANAYITVANPTTTPALTFDATQLNAGFVQQTEPDAVSLSSTLTATLYPISGNVGFNVGTTAGQAALYMSDGSSNWTSLWGYPNISANWSLYFPSSGTATAGKVLAAKSGSTATSTTLEWITGGTGVVNSVVAGTGITVDATNVAAPIVALSTTTPLWVKQTGETRNVATSGTLTAVELSATSKIYCGTGATGGVLAIQNPSGKLTNIYNQGTQAANINLALPPTVGGSGYLLQTDGAGLTSWTNAVSVNTGVFNSQVGAAGVRFRGVVPATQYIDLSPPASLSGNYSMILPGAGGSNGSQLTWNAGGVLSWGTAFAGKSLPTDTLNYYPLRGGNPPSYLKYYMDYNYATADSASIAGGTTDNSYLAVDTTYVPIKTEPVTLDQTLHVLGVATFEDWVVGEAGFTDPTSTFSIAPDTSYFDAGGWYQDRLKVGSGEATDRLTVDGSVAVSGTSALHDLGVTGFITATTKIAASDSVSAYKSLIAGKPSAAGTVVLHSGTGYTQTLQTSAAIDSNEVLSLFRWARVDTFLCKTTRWPDGRTGTYKRFEGVRENDMLVVSANGLATGAHPVVTIEGTTGFNDSLLVIWASGNDNKTLTIWAIRP